MSKKLELIPSARRLVRSLRDMGYDFPSAVADVMDNSIEAGASRISVDVRYDGDDSWVRIADNGHGMKPETLREALRYGADREYDLDFGLGKFGLGLKTASLSQCQRLTVSSRSSKERADIYAVAWDLDHIDRSNRWELLEIRSGESFELVREPLLDHPGTVVLWQGLDRILGSKSDGEVARRRIASTCRDLELHLAMVFHRFLTGSAGVRKISIRVNGNAVTPWDPFALSEPATRTLEPITLNHDERKRSAILIQRYVLPHQEAFSSPQAHAIAAGPRKWNAQQGFYIYRANRMIQSGGWSHLRAADEHTKLARVALSFGPVLDDLFRINVMKMRVQLPAVHRDAIREAIGPVLKLAEQTYRKRNGSSKSAADQSGRHEASPSCSVHGSEGTIGSGSSSSSSTWRPESGTTPSDDAISAVRRRAEAIATAAELPVIQSVFDRLTSGNKQ